MVCPLVEWQIQRNPRPVLFLQVPMPGSFGCYQLLGVLCHFNFYLHSPPLWKAVFLVWKAHFWICDFHFYYLIPLELVFWHILAALSSFYPTDLLESALWPWTMTPENLLSFKNSPPVGISALGNGWRCRYKIATTHLYLLFPSPSTLTVSRKVQGFSKCKATTYIAHQD